MPSSFIGKAKPFNGVMTPCKKCQRIATLDQDLYLQNLGTIEEKKWISCIDIECFVSQGGSKPELKIGSAVFQKKSRTTAERLEEAYGVLPNLQTYAQNMTLANFKDTTATEQRIQTAVFLKALVEIFCRY